MRKAVFLFPKYQVYDWQELADSGSNELMVGLEGLTEDPMSHIKNLPLKLGLSITAFSTSVCPLDPVSKARLKELLTKAVSLNPNTIWLDHLRFDGHWEAMKRNRLPDEHLPCQWCRGKNKVAELLQLSLWARSVVPSQIELGYFVVPFKSEEVPALIKEMGQSHLELSQAFDIISPMLYHRMIEKPTNYISEFVSYISGLTAKPILPILQIKDLPDSVPDNLVRKEIVSAFQEASKPPSVGVSWFCWDDAMEKDKTKLITEVFHSPTL